jgi:hypothetical protein
MAWAPLGMSDRLFILGSLNCNGADLRAGNIRSITKRMAAESPCIAIVRHFFVTGSAYSDNNPWAACVVLLRLPVGRPLPAALPVGNGRPRALAIGAI